MLRSNSRSPARTSPDPVVEQPDLHHQLAQPPPIASPIQCPAAAPTMAPAGLPPERRKPSSPNEPIRIAWQALIMPPETCSMSSKLNVCITTFLLLKAEAVSPGHVGKRPRAASGGFVRRGSNSPPCRRHVILSAQRSLRRRGSKPLRKADEPSIARPEFTPFRPRPAPPWHR